MQPLPPNHFLALPRPDIFAAAPAAGVPDTTTLAAHDFDVDTRTGFMPPQPPLTRLPSRWEVWEVTLEKAAGGKLQLAARPDVTPEEEEKAEAWRDDVRQLPILPIDDLKASELLLRRAHHVLAWIMHFYVHTMPMAVRDIHIPPPVTVPLLQVSAQLQLPPVVTYSDDVLYNWEYKVPPPADTLLDPALLLNNLQCLTTFSGTRDEEEFYLASARIELRGVEALSIMRAIMDEAFAGDAIAHRRITTYLHALARVIDALTVLLAGVHDGVRPEVFYHGIRPWFKGADSDTTGRKWVFDGLDLDPTLAEPTELSGPSAGQSSLIHALDIFLGVEHDIPPHGHGHGHGHAARAHPHPHPHPTPPSTSTLGAAAGEPQVPFLTRMKLYMPRHHRAFLRHLAASPRPLRRMAAETGDAALRAAYDVAVGALKAFRDEHVRVVARFILVQARRGPLGASVGAGATKGTGGTDAFEFVRSVRDQTADAVLGKA